MKIRVVDYNWPGGGHRRFVIEMLKAFVAAGVGELEFVSHGYGAAQYRRLLGEERLDIKLLDIAPRRSWYRDGYFGFNIPSAALADCDVAWVPFTSHHRLPPGTAGNVVGSFHDGLKFTEPRIAGPDPATAREERETALLWLASGAAVICSSRLWLDFLEKHFAHRAEDMHVVALAGDHVRAEAPAAPNSLPTWPWIDAPYLLCPASTTGNKNHELLFEAYRRAEIGWPLVLTGIGSDFTDPMPFGYRILRHAAVLAGLRAPRRGRGLKRLLRRLGLKPGSDVIPLGYLPDGQYHHVLAHAACVVMPTLGEGGGSFPVEEALIRGVPVICSDIPVMREHMERLGAEVAWFDPLRAEDLAAQLREIFRDYPARRRAALAQRDKLRLRTWRDVAADYLAIMARRRFTGPGR